MSTKNNAVDLEKVVIKFAGDSGDGMQLTGTQFTDTSALLGNDLATFPDYPAEIRAPIGTVAGVSGFQVHIGNVEINTPGDIADVLVAMNPAALKANRVWIKDGGTIIVNSDSFTKKDLEKAGYQTNPLEDETFDAYNLVQAPITSLTRETLKDSGLDGKSIGRSKNMFALGMVYWMFNRPMEQTENFLNAKFAKKPLIVESNIKVLHAGYNFADTIEALPSSYTVAKADIDKGTYRNIMGNQATAWGFIAAAEKSGKELFLGSYPITPATDILHELAKHKNLGVKTFQAEDEIAGICSAIGASFAGDLAITTTSGPGLALKGEALGLAMIAELPLVVVNVQRGGPSTGLPTKTEQSDLLQALYGRNGESPVVVVAASTPSNCFDWAFEASRLALEHNTPVVLLTDGYLGNGAGPWKIRSVKDMPNINPLVATQGEDWQPYARDVEKLARKHAIPGTKGLEHRLGGLEKDELTGNVSYDPDNHEVMCSLRAEKVERVTNFIPNQEIFGDEKGDVLVVGWGGTYGSLYTAVKELREEGKDVSLAHFNYINPLPKNTAEIFSNYKTIVVCEINKGQFVSLLRMKHPEFKYEQFNHIQGLPFKTTELKEHFNTLLS
ncbi:MAG: 2-oxoacid:acceptor oxidoreductase subunit alpha [Flavobacteriales bacterium]|nr:2-oxoacid:acceptor oxidoreductase subunit alpha [Flavobacteriales bacterium]